MLLIVQLCDELRVACCSDEIIHFVNNLKELQKSFRSSYLMSQDHAEVNLYGIAARYVVTVVNKKIWESHHDSHAVTIQWVHVVVDPLLPKG